jgi:hypothetical protein
MKYLASFGIIFVGLFLLWYALSGKAATLANALQAAAKATAGTATPSSTASPTSQVNPIATPPTMTQISDLLPSTPIETPSSWPQAVSV